MFASVSTHDALLLLEYVHSSVDPIVIDVGGIHRAALRYVLNDGANDRQSHAAADEIADIIIRSTIDVNKESARIALIGRRFGSRDEVRDHLRTMYGSNSEFREKYEQYVTSSTDLWNGIVEKSPKSGRFSLQTYSLRDTDFERLDVFSIH